MSDERHSRQVSFWRVVGIGVGSALLLSSLYILVSGGSGALVGSLSPWSDALCVSALLLGLGGGIPFLLDAGRGLTLSRTIGTTEESRRHFWDEERAKREKGMRITFALGLAALLIGLISLLVSLL